MRKLYCTLTIALACVYSLNAEDYAGWAAGLASDGYGTIIYSDTTGREWVRQGSNQIPNVGMSGVYAVDYETAWVVGKPDSGYGTIFYTEDAGATWTRKGLGSPALENKELMKVHCCGTNVWAVGQSVIAYSPDNGMTWTNFISDTYSNTMFQAVFVVNSTCVWVGGEGATAPPDNSATILKTMDAGANWTRQTNGNVMEINHVLGINALNEEYAYAVGGDGFAILKTTDGGDTWVLQTNRVQGLGDANEVYVVNTQTVYVAVDNFIEWSHDAGASWNSHTLSYYTMGTCAINESQAWAAIQSPIGTGQVWYTSNAGVSWTEQKMHDGTRPAPLITVSFAKDPIPEPALSLFLISISSIYVLRNRIFSRVQ